MRLYERLAEALDKVRPIVVSAWPEQARRSLLAAGWSDQVASTSRMARESERLLREVADRLAVMHDRHATGDGGRGAKSVYELLGARVAGHESAARTASLLQLHRSLMHFVWALALPEMAAELSAEEIAIAQAALIDAARRTLGILPENRSEGDVQP
jgi:hypothetical protein